MYYDKTGKHISLMEWADLIENKEYCRIAETFCYKYRISTIWLGINYNFCNQNDEDKLIFETMIFCEDDKDEYHERMVRYGTLEEALKGHEETINLIEGKQMKKDDMMNMMDMLKSMLEMKEKMEEFSSKMEKEEENPKDCPIASSLEKEYNDIMFWALGSYRFSSFKRDKAIEIWQAMHPDLPVPRILKSSLVDATTNTLGLLIDIIPLYHEDKKRKCKCANAN